MKKQSLWYWEWFCIGALFKAQGIAYNLEARMLQERQALFREELPLRFHWRLVKHMPDFLILSSKR
jgi:hypothetical protein